MNTRIIGHTDVFTLTHKSDTRMNYMAEATTSICASKAFLLSVCIDDVDILECEKLDLVLVSVVFLFWRGNDGAREYESTTEASIEEEHPSFLSLTQM